MKQATINRIYQRDCTIGILNYGVSARACTLELPYLDNKQSVSCIPAGYYIAKYRKSPSNGDVIELKSVPGRSYIQIHSGNYTSQIEGCILVGDSIVDINKDGILDVANSRETLSKLLEWAGYYEFVLIIK